MPIETVSLFVTAVASKWWAAFGALVAGGLVEFVGITSPRFQAMLESRFPKDRRRPLLVWLLFLLFVWASFEAFQEEHDARVRSENAQRSLLRKNDELHNKLEISNQKLALKTPLELRETVRELHVVDKAPLSRDLKRDFIQLNAFNYNVNGSHAVSMADIDYTDVTSVILQYKNIGNNTLNWSVKKVKATFPNGETANAIGLVPTLISAGDGSRQEFKFDHPVKIERSFSRIQMEVMFEYDTVPASGMRQSLLKGFIEIQWIPPQVNNNRIDVASPIAMVVVKDDET